MPVVGVPLGLHRQPQVEGRDVFGPEVKLILDLELGFRDQAEGLERLGQLVLGIPLLGTGDAEVTTRPEARGFPQFFARAATSLR